jgi:putative tributyrin esterase
VARVRCDFYSDVLQLGTSMTVLLPQQTATQIGVVHSTGRSEPPPVLYLLHGLSDDDTTWVRQTAIERYAASLGIAVVLPQVHRSFYADEVHGGRYWTFLSEELPELVGHFFRVSHRRSDTFVAGLSMGGYGALKWALRQPERFAAAASLSGALDVAALRARRRLSDPTTLDRIFGPAEVAGSDADLLALLRRADASTLPNLYLCCGTEDELIMDNMTFRDACGQAGVPLTVDFGVGRHEWPYWDARIQDVLAWLPVGRDD